MQKETQTCTSCGKDKELKHFYASYSPFTKNTGKHSVCKDCILDYLNQHPDNIDHIKNTLRMLDTPFIQRLWESSLEEANSRVNKSNPFRIYMKNVVMPQYRGLTWKDSEFTSGENMEVDELSGKVQINANYLESLREKYGDGYPDNEYVLFEKKFNQLKTSFQLPTTMHEEYLREYCVNKVKETLAKTQGNFKEAKEWAAMAKESAEAGKLKPSQMSKADLSQGLDGFGQLARMVEQHQDIIPLLPRFTQQPKDKVDVTLWHYINYVRDLKGLPEASYKDIWKFYDERAKEYESQELDIELEAKQKEMTDKDE